MDDGIFFIFSNSKIKLAMLHIAESSPPFTVEVGPVEIPLPIQGG